MNSDRERGQREQGGKWRCSQCEEVFEPFAAVSADFRWAGTHWQHYHGYPMGHCPMKREPDEVEPSKMRQRIDGADRDFKEWCETRGEPDEVERRLRAIDEACHGDIPPAPKRESDEVERAITTYIRSMDLGEIDVDHAQRIESLCRELANKAYQRGQREEREEIEEELALCELLVISRRVNWADPKTDIIRAALREAAAIQRGEET